MLSKNFSILNHSFVLILLVSFMYSCTPSPKKVQDESKARAKLDKLLTSLEKKDVVGLKEVMSNSDNMELIFTSGDITSSTAEFIEFHEKWFQDSSWTMRHEIVNFKYHGNFATATVKAFYKEPDREGSPYFHNMMVSYVLKELENGEWSIIKDQATTFDKAKDK